MTVSSVGAVNSIAMKLIIMESSVKGDSRYLSLCAGLLLCGPQSISSANREVATIWSIEFCL